MVRVVFHGIHHDCRSCGGQLVGLVPFQEQVAPADAGRIWRESEAGPVVGSCPFCDGDLRAPTNPTDTGGIAVCRLCEQVWVPQAAEPWMHAHTAPNPSEDPYVPPVPEECMNCGAPYSPDEEGQCRFCHAQLTPLAPIIVAISSDN